MEYRSGRMTQDYRRCARPARLARFRGGQGAEELQNPGLDPSFVTEHGPNKPHLLVGVIFSRAPPFHDKTVEGWGYPDLLLSQVCAIRFRPKSVHILPQHPLIAMRLR